MYVREQVHACVRAYVTQSLYLSVRAFTRSLQPLQILHQEVVSVQQAGTPRTCLSLWQCSDRATHLSTDALPVSGGCCGESRASFSLTLFPFLSLFHPQTLSLFLALLSTRRTPSRFLLCVLSTFLSSSPSPCVSLLSYVASFSAPRLESLSTVRAPPHKLPCAPGANTNPCGSPDARRRR